MAKEKFVRLPNGKELTFPVSMSDTEIQQKIIGELFAVPKYEELPEEKKAPSFFEAFGEGVTTLGDVPEVMRYLYEPRSATARKEAAATAESPYAYTGVSDIEGPASLGRFIKEQAGQALGFVAPAAAASATTARVTPGPPALKAAAGVGAFLTTAGAQYLANTTGRQAAEQEKAIKEGKAPEMPDVTKLLLTSTAQAGLDIAGFRFFKPLGNLIGIGGREAVKDTAEELAKIAAKEGPEKAASILAGTTKGVLFEGAQETVQQLLERVGAGLDLSSDEAIREYYESALAGGILGGALGAGTTAVQKVGTKAKDELARLALEAREAKDPKKLWKDAKKDILKESEPLSILDEQGNPVPITKEFLADLGVNPEAKALAGVPMESILNQPATDGGVAQTLVKYFTDKIQDINATLERKDLTDEQRSELTTTYERLSTGLKTFTQRATEAKKEKEKAEREAQTIPLFKLPEGFEFQKKNEKALKGILIDPQGRSRGEFASLEEAALFANTLYRPAKPIAPAEPVTPTPAAPAAEAAPTITPTEKPTPAPETVKETLDRMGDEAKVAEEFGLPTPKVEAAAFQKKIQGMTDEQIQDDVEIGFFSYTDEQLALLKDELARRKAGVRTTTTAAPEPTLESINAEIDAVLAKQKEIKEKIDTYLSADTRGRLVTPKRGSKRYNEWQALKEEYDNLVNYLGGNLLPKRDKARRAAPAAPAPAPTPEPEVTPMPEAAPEVAEQMTYLREELGMDGLASAISSRPAAEQIALSKQVTDTLGQINQLEQNRRALKNQGDEASVKAVTEQIRKLENSLDDLEYSLTETPNTREAVQEAIKKNGNAAEANKIAGDINKENGCK